MINGPNLWLILLLIVRHKNFDRVNVHCYQLIITEC